MKETTLQNIQVQGVKTTIKDLIIENENLAAYLLESDSREDAFNAVIDFGVKSLNVVKNTMEKEFMMDQFNNAVENFNSKYNEYENFISKESNKYFDEKDGVVIKQVTSAMDNLKNEVDNLIVDSSNPESAISQFNDLMIKFEDTFTNLVENIFDPNSKNKNNIMNNAVNEIVKQVTLVISPMLTALKTHLDVNDALDNTTKKGTPYEKQINFALQSIKGPGDLVELTKNKPGLIKNSKKGDLVYSISNSDSSLSGAKIVFEAKNHKEITSLDKCEIYLDLAMKNREAQVGIWVVKNQETIQQFTNDPFTYYHDKAFVVFNDEVGDMPLKIAVLWAKWRSGQLLNPESIDALKVEELNTHFTGFREDLTMLSNLGSQIDTSITAASNAKGILNDINTRVQTRLNLIKDVLDDN